MQMTAELTKHILYLINRGDFLAARDNCIQMLQKNPKNADGYFLLGITLLGIGNINKAVELIHQAISLAPNNSEYLTQLAKSYVVLNDTLNAKKYADLALSLNPQSPITIDTLGVVYSKLGLHEKAITLFSKAVSNNRNPSFLLNLAMSLKFIGDFGAAREAYESVIELAPHFYKAHSGLTSLGGISPDNNHIDRLTRQLKNAKSNAEYFHLCHAAAKEYESLGDYETAFHYLKKGKQNRLAEIQYRFDDEEPPIFKALKAFFTQEIISLKSGFETEEPIFVVGMPRTGTTLVERIISNHAEVTTIGESHQFGVQLKKLSRSKTNRVIDSATIDGASSLDFSQLGAAYINSVRPQTGKTLHFVDKMPLNFLLIGFIVKALPNAKIICLRRNPLDTCTSNYRQLFSTHTPYYNYSYDLLSTAKYYLLFRDLMDFWQNLFPKNVYSVNYESLVNSPETQTKKLYDFLSLNWHADMLDITQNTAPVATASAVQIREPINNRSVGSWKKYERHLSQVKQLLIKHQIPFE